MQAAAATVPLAGPLSHRRSVYKAPEYRQRKAVVPQQDPPAQGRSEPVHMGGAPAAAAVPQSGSLTQRDSDPVPSSSLQAVAAAPQNGLLHRKRSDPAVTADTQAAAAVPQSGPLTHTRSVYKAPNYRQRKAVAPQSGKLDQERNIPAQTGGTQAVAAAPQDGPLAQRRSSSVHRADMQANAAGILSPPPRNQRRCASAPSTPRQPWPESSPGYKGPAGAERARLPGLPVKLGQARTPGTPRSARQQTCGRASEAGSLSPRSPVAELAACKT